MKTNKQQLRRLVGTAILAALVVVLQTLVVIPIGIFQITLTLVPIMLGAILFGPSSGAFLGAVFGVTVSVQVVTGAAGPLSFAMFESKPVITIAICLLKGILAGLCAGLIHKLFSSLRKGKLGVLFAAAACPIVNTGIFVAALFLFYYGLMSEFAALNAFANAVTFIFIGIVGLNFVVEFAINVLLIPVVLRVIHAIQSKM